MYIKDNNALENMLTSSHIHAYEDYIRAKMILNINLTIYDNIILCRILWGRILNSSKCSNKILDSRHSKAQMITILCLFFYLKQKPFNHELNKLLIYHLNKIDEYLKINNYHKLKGMNQKYYLYCNYWKNVININGNIDKNIKQIELILIIPKITTITVSLNFDKLVSKYSIDDFIE